MYNDLSHYLLTISIFSAFIIKYSSITQRWILSFYFIVSSLSFYAALVGYIDSDFSVYNIFTNSNANTPLFYKISSTWSNHEGSLLLWCWFLTLYGFVFCYSITIFESNRKNRERSFYEFLCCNTSSSKNSIDKKDIHVQKKKGMKSFLFSIHGDEAFHLKKNTQSLHSLHKHHAILFVNQSQKQPVLFSVLEDNKQEHKKRFFLDQSFSSFFKDNHLQNINGQIESTTEIQHKHRDSNFLFAYLKHSFKKTAVRTQFTQNTAVFFVGTNITSTKEKKETVLFPSTLYFQALLKNPLESLIQEKQLYPQKYTEIDHLASFKRFKPFGNTYSMQKKLYRHDLKTQSIGQQLSIQKKSIQLYVPQLENCSFNCSLDEVYSNRNRFNTAWISFCFSKFNQWKNTRQRTQPFVIYVSIILWFCAFLLMTSNPFLKTPFLCINSVTELNPVLQDPVLAIHPPCIYAGYVASAIGFSIALSYLSLPRLHGSLFVATATTSRTQGKHIQKAKEDIHSLFFLEAFPFLPLPLFNIGGTKKSLTGLQEKNTKWLLAEFTKQIRFWILTCWCFLTIGILLGSWWAYHELGWGGWWFWDPVENASLMPWLLATACIHSILAPKLQSWTFMLSIVTFMLSILGTFFVRSGLLASVHSFATDSTRGLFILCFLLCVFLLSITFFVRWLFFFNYNNQLRLKVPITTVENRAFEGSSSNCSLEQKIQQRTRLEKQTLGTFGLVFKTNGNTKTKTAVEAATHKYKKEIEQLLQIQNVILCIICLVILCGTAAPILFQWLFQRDVSTGASFFNATTIPLFVTAILVMIYVHYAQLIYLKNSRSEKIGLWEWSVFYPNCISQKAHPFFQTAAAVKKKLQEKNAAAVYTLKTPLLGQKATGKIRYHNFVSVLSKAALRSFVEYRMHILDNYSSWKPWICFFCSVFVFFSHVLILHYLTDFSYLESILAALCFVLCCYIVMSSTHHSFHEHVAVNKTSNCSNNNNSMNNSSLEETSVLCLFVNQCNKSGTWSSSAFKADNIAMVTKKSSVVNKKNNRDELQLEDKTPFYSNAVTAAGMKPNVFSEMKHKSFLTTASRLIMLIDKNPFRRIAFNMRLSHIGVLVFLIGVIVSNRKKIQLVQIMRFGQQMQLDNSICSLRSIDQNYGPTYHSICGNIIIQPQTYKHVFHGLTADLFLGLNNWTNKNNSTAVWTYEKKHSKALCFPTYSKNTNSCVVTGGQEPHICMFPEKRFFFSSMETLSTTKVAIYTNLFTDFYALIGTGSAETGWYTTIMQLPFIFCIWIGFLLAACGGLYSLRLLMKTSHLKWQ